MKRIFGLLATILFLLVLKANAQSSAEESTVRMAVQLYFEGMMERDKAKLDQAFHSEARLIGYRGSSFTVTPYEIWAANTSKGEKRDLSQFRNEVVSVEVKGNMAIAKAELFWPGIYYFDYLTLLLIEGDWKIVHKSWYEELR
jgi:hypothetical protein